MKKIAIVIITIILAVALFLIWHSGYLLGPTKVPVDSTPLPEGIVLFYGDGCPHCENVDEFVAQNNIEDKIKFSRFEVWHNQANAQLLVNTATSCKVDISAGVPIPLLYDGSFQCFVGDQDIINFFKNAANIK